jgi:peptidoglycan/LPS O-acetylase OafA/YrhL
MKYFQSIQILRFVAATFVVFAHMGIGIHSYKGIDILFVISGFIIYWTSRTKIGKGNAAALRFMKRRVIRIFTFYWVLFFSLIALGIYSVQFDRTFVANVFLLPGHKSFLEVTWSLSVELYFYVLFAFAILFLSKKTAQKTAITFWALTFLLLGLEYTNYPIKGTPLNFFLGQNIGLILAGVLTGIFYEKSLLLETQKRLIYSAFCLTIGLFLFLIIVDYYSNISFACVGIGSSLLLFGILTIEELKRPKFPALLMHLGSASYVAYLIHIPIIHYFSSTPALKTTNQFLIIIGIWFLSLFLYQLIEKPLVERLNKFFG